MFLKSLPKSILCARPKSMILMRGWGTERFSSMMFSGWRTHKQIKNKNSKVRMWPKKKTQMWSDKPDTESNEKLFLFLIKSIGKRSDDFRRSAEIKTDRGTKTAGQTNTGKLRQEGEPIRTSRTRPGGGRREKDGALDEPRKQKSHIPENTKSPWGKDSKPPNLQTSEPPPSSATLRRRFGNENVCRERQQREVVGKTMTNLRHTHSRFWAELCNEN